MRAPVTFFLVGLLLACPALCRATEGGCCAERGLASGDTDGHHAPVPSDDTASCICRGAIKAPHLRAHGQDSGSPLSVPVAFLPDDLTPTLRSLADAYRTGGPPAHLDRQGSGRLRALLQNFRF